MLYIFGLFLKLLAFAVFIYGVALIFHLQFLYGFGMLIAAVGIFIVGELVAVYDE